MPKKYSSVRNEKPEGDTISFEDIKKKQKEKKKKSKIGDLLDYFGRKK